MALPSSINRRGTRAAQPAATAVAAGTIYGVTDEGNILERSTGAAWEAYSPEGAGTESTAFGAETLTADGALDFYDNSFYVGRYDGADWIPWGPIFPMVQPVDGDFAWVNQGGASVNTTNGGIYLLAPLSATVSLRARVKSAPATPYTITAAFLPNLARANFQGCGLLFRQSSDGKIATAGLATNATLLELASLKYTDATNFSAGYTTINVGAIGGSVVWLRIADDGANRIISYSGDGQHWLTLHSVGRTDFLTATQVGFFVNDQTNATQPAMTLLSWEEA